MMNTKIKKIYARQILDSRGNPTIEVDVTLKCGAFGRASVPSGASTGAFEAVELRDKDNSLYLGKSVYNAVKNVNEIIAQNIVGLDAKNQFEIDNLMLKLDGSKNKGNLGANAILGVSLAICRAVANAKGVPLYEYINLLYNKTEVTFKYPFENEEEIFVGALAVKEEAKILPRCMFNILNGGKHADNSVNIQEFMIVPTKSEKINTFSDALMCATIIYHKLKGILKENGYSTAVGDEGGFAPNLESDEDALKLINQAVEDAGYNQNKNSLDVYYALDIASSEMKNEAEKCGKPKNYYFWKTDKMFTASSFVKYQQKLIDKYPICLIEDGLGEEDWENWQTMTSELKDKIQLVGDDLFVTNLTRLDKGIKKGVANAILIKPNQIGSLTETLYAIKMAKNNGYGVVISHRSGETDDSFISHLVVGTNAEQLKSGAPCRMDRLSKYNELIRISEKIPQFSDKK